MSTRLHLAMPYFALCLAVAGCSDPVEKLITQLSSPNPANRRAAVLTLGERTPPEERTIAALTKVVTDSDTQVRQTAINALAQIGPAAKPSLPALKQALEDSDIAVRRRAAFAIQRIDPNDTSFQPVLNAAMREGHGQTLLAVGAMGKDAEWAVPTLIGLLSHREAKVRSLAAHTLGRVGVTARDAKAPLQRLLRDPNSAVRGAAQDALNYIEKPSTGGNDTVD